MKKVIIYARKSTESDERQVQSIDSQIQWARQYCELHQLEVVEIISESKSAKAPGERAGFVIDIE